jgi:hypothetical protein
MIRESIEKIQDISHDRTIVIYLYMIVPVHRTGLVTGSNGSLDTGTGSEYGSENTTSKGAECSSNEAQSFTSS